MKEQPHTYAVPTTEQEISHTALSIVNSSVRNIQLLILNNRLTINQIRNTPINTDILNKLTQGETDEYAITFNNRHRRSIETTKRKQYLQTFDQKQIECEQYTKQIIQQSKTIKEYYNQIKLKKQIQDEQKAEAERKIKEAEEQQKLKEKEQIREHQHIEFKKLLEVRQSIRNRNVKTKAPKWHDYSNLYTEQTSTRNLTVDTISTQSKEINSLKTIGMHEKEYLSLKKQKEEERKEKLKQLIMSAEPHKSLLTSFDRKASIERKKLKGMHSELKKQKAMKIEKMKIQAMIFQELYKPKIDEQKKKEIQEIIQKDHKTLNITTPDAEEAKKKRQSKPWRHNISKNPTISHSPAQLPTIFKYPNYLKTTNNDEKAISTKKIKEVINDPNMSPFEKYDSLKPQLNWLEEKAKMKEENISASKGLDDVSFEQATGYYVNAIQAKLSLLKQLS